MGHPQMNECKRKISRRISPLQAWNCSLSLIPCSLSRIDGDSLGARGRATDRLLRQPDADQLIPRSGPRRDRRQEKKVALWMAARTAADQRYVAVDRPFRHAANYRIREQVLHPRSSTRTLCEPRRNLHQQRNRVRPAGSTHRVDLRSSPAVAGLLLGPGRQPCRHALFRALLP